MASAARDSGITPAPAAASDRRAVVMTGALIVLAGALAYANSLGGPFLYDDKTSIVYNGTIRHLSHWRELFNPPGDGATVGGRPVLNLTFALNYAISGLNVRGYHLTNVAIHLLSALTLFGLVRRTLLLPAFASPVRSAALPLAFVVASLWAVHPLDTEAVTYVVQRAESLMALFFLLTLYAFVRGVTSPYRRAWQAAAIIACLLGIGTKENLAAAPLAVLLFDRAFVSGSFRAAWRARRAFHLAMAATWILLGALVLRGGGNRGGTVGFDVGVSWLQYLLTQIPALVRYASLSLWPAQLDFDYGLFYVTDFGSLAWQAVIAAAIVGGGVYALFRAPKAGFVAGTALAILAPTSLLPGVSQMIVEHRMYLPLAAVAASTVPIACVIGVRRLVWPAAVAIAALVLTTAARNRIYRDEITLWSDAIAKSPRSLVAHSSLGAALAAAGRRADAIREDRWVVARNPNYAPALANLGIALTEAGQPSEALPHLMRAITVAPANAQAQLNLGVTLDALGRAAEAVPHYAAAAALNPLLADAQNDYGDALCRAGRFADGIPHLREAIRLSPDYAEAYFNLAAAYVRTGRMSEAQQQFARATALRPADATLHLNWANFLFGQGHRVEAWTEYQIALRLCADDPEIHFSVATALVSDHQIARAIPEYEAAIRLRPDYSEAHNNLGNALLALERESEAVPHYQEALRTRPNNAATHNNLGLALARTGRLREAAVEFEQAVRLAPGFTQAKENLTHAREQLGMQPGG